MTPCRFQKLPLSPSSTMVLSHRKKHFHHCVPRNTICCFFNYIASLRQQTASNGNSFVISIWGEMKFPNFKKKIRLLLSQNGHLPLADSSECPGAELRASVPRVRTGNDTMPLQLVGAMQPLTFAVEIREWRCRRAYKEMSSTAGLAAVWGVVIPCAACIVESVGSTMHDDVVRRWWHNVTHKGKRIRVAWVTINTAFLFPECLTLHP